MIGIAFFVFAVVVAGMIVTLLPELVGWLRERHDRDEQDELEWR